MKTEYKIMIASAILSLIVTYVYTGTDYLKNKEDELSKQTYTDRIMYKVRPYWALYNFELKTDANNISMIHINREPEWRYDIFSHIEGIDGFCKLNKKDLLVMEFTRDEIIFSKKQMEKYGEEYLIKHAELCTEAISLSVQGEREETYTKLAYAIKNF